MPLVPGLSGRCNIGPTGDRGVRSDYRHESACELGQVAHLVVPLLKIRDGQHVLLTEVGKSLNDVHRQLLVEVDLRGCAWVVRRQDVLNRVLVTVVV